MDLFFEEKKNSYKIKRHSNLVEVSKVMDTLKKKFGLDEVLFVIMKVWQEIANEDSQVCGFRAGTLYIQTQYPTVIQELTMRKKEIISKLNQYLGVKKVKNIKVEIGS